MKRSIVVIVTAILFAIIGLAASAISTMSVRPRNEDMAMIMCLGPPIMGALLGLVIGCAAVVCESCFQGED